jgi:LAO/AO transport system kinase
VVNKADLPGAERTVQEIRSMLGMGPKLTWRPPIVTTVASDGGGTEEVLAAIEGHREHAETTGEAGRRAEARLRDEVADLVGEWARSEARHLLDSEPELAARLLRDRIPYAVAEEILTRQGRRLVPEAARTDP